MNRFDTHEVFNQVSPFVNVNLFTCDTALREALEREGGAFATASLMELGAELGTAEMQELARQANEHPPVLKNFDRGGHRIDEVEFHPAWHKLMELMIASGAHASPWDGKHQHHGAQVARAARYILFGQVENGAQCPITMTYASVPALRQSPGLAARWLPKILSRVYDPSPLPIDEKRGALIGMGMTEKQGGSDLRANTTQAEALGADEVRAVFGADSEPVYRLTGHKWFFLRTPMRCTSGAGPGRRRGTELLPRAALPAEWGAQPGARAAAEGKAWQQIKRLIRSRIHRRLRLAAGRLGPWSSDHP